MSEQKTIKIGGDVENANINTGDNVQQTINNYGISKQDYDKYVKELGVTDCALDNFLSESEFTELMNFSE